MSVIDEMKQAGAMLENCLHCGGLGKLKVSNGEKRSPAKRAGGVDWERRLCGCLAVQLPDF